MTRIAPHTRANARRLRADLTPQERAVWAALRDLNRSFGTHFRRQAPIGPFIADFADYGRRLVIEIDGGQHGGEVDAARDGFLAAQGYRVMRFWNSDVTGNLDGVLQVVLEAVGVDGPPPRSPPHKGGVVMNDRLSEVAMVDPLSLTLSHRGRGDSLCAAGQHWDSGRIPSPPVGEGQGEGVPLDTNWQVDFEDSSGTSCSIARRSR